jgi:hypothetical protein
MWLMQSDEATAFVKQLIEDPKRYPDRVVGIVLGAVLDDRLTDVISHYVQPNEKIFEDTFGHESGIFGSFGSRVAVGFFLGLYSVETHRDLTLIAKIRNDFAHKIGTETFETSPIRDRIDQLKIVDKRVVVKNKALWDFGDPNDFPLPTRGDRYIRAIQLLNGAFFALRTNSEPNRRIPQI